MASAPGTLTVRCNGRARRVQLTRAEVVAAIKAVESARAREAGPAGRRPLGMEASVEAWRMRQRGYTVEYVAAALGTTVARVQSAVRRVENGRYGSLEDLEA